MNARDEERVAAFIRTVGRDAARRATVARPWENPFGIEWRSIDVIIDGQLHSVSWTDGTATQEEIRSTLRAAGNPEPRTQNSEP